MEEKLKELISGYNSYEEFEESLIREGITVNILREDIKENFLVRNVIDKHINSQISVAPKELTNHYNEHLDEYKALPKYICWVAKADKKDFLDKLADSIKKEGLNKVIEENKDIFFKIQSDEQGLKQELKEVVKSIKEDEFKITKIDETNYLVYLKKIVPPHNKFLDEVKDEIYSYLWGEKFKACFSQWIEGLENKAIIKIYDQ